MVCKRAGLMQEIKIDDISDQNTLIQNNINDNIMKKIKNMYVDSDITMVYYMRNGLTISKAYVITDINGFT